MAKPSNIPFRFGPHQEFPGLGNAFGRPAFVDTLIPFDFGPPPPCIEVSIDVGTLSGPPVIFNAAGNPYCFTDNVLVTTDVLIRGFSSDDVIKLSGTDRTEYNFSSGPQDERDLWITYFDGVNFTNIILDNVLTGGFVFDYASAMASVGHDFLISGCIEVSIDVGAPLAAVTIDAAAADFCFADAANVTTQVVLQNFAAGDRIEVSGATASDYNFARSFDDINDLVITYTLASGATNLIVIDDVLPDAGVVANYALAVAAIGFDFMTFG
jgi:hypothetical protein